MKFNISMSVNNSKVIPVILKAAFQLKLGAVGKAAGSNPYPLRDIFLQFSGLSVG